MIGGRCLIAALGMLGAGVTTPLPAQARHSLSFEITLGSMNGRGGGPHTRRTTTGMEMLLAWRARALGGGSLVLGVSRGWPMATGDDASCAVAPAGGCLPAYPEVRTSGVLVGMELGGRGTGASARAMLGPAHAVIKGSGAHGSEVLGLLGRVDLASAAPFRLALVASLRALALPDVRDERLVITTAALGLRIQ